MTWWQQENDGASWGARTISNRLKDRAGKFLHPDSKKTFFAAKNVDWGYRGIRLTDIFQRRFDQRARGRGSKAEGGEEWSV